MTTAERARELALSLSTDEAAILAALLAERRAALEEAMKASQNVVISGMTIPYRTGSLLMREETTRAIRALITPAAAP
jgi:hypothetical protein